MHNEFTAILERDGEWYVAYCSEIPGADDQGQPKDEADASLAEDIALILDDRGEDSLSGCAGRCGARDGDRQLKVLTNDHHFEQEGFSVLMKGAP